MRWTITLLMAVVLLPSASGQDTKDRSESELLKKLRNGSIVFDDVDEAWSQLKVAIRENPSDDWCQARMTLARAFVHVNEFDTAIDILKQAFDFHLLELGQSHSGNDLHYMYELARQIADFASRSSTPDVETEVLDILVPILRKRVATNEYLDINSRRLMTTLNLRCRTLSHQTAKKLLESEFDRARKVFEANPENRFAAFAFIDALKPMAVPPYAGGKPDIDRINELLGFVTELREHKDIHKVVWGMEYYDTNHFVIEQIVAERPDDAQRFVADAIATLKHAGEDDINFERMFDFRIRNLDAINQKVAAAKRHLTIVGKAAPVFDAAGWINGEPTQLDQLLGKVVLLDFTAVWCGPCIQQIPELKMLHNKYAQQGLVIISVTDQYDFTWDDEQHGPKKSDETVELPEQLAMLEQFVSHYSLPFRLMLTEKGSGMAESLGVSSIPHAVLIDKTGIVRMIRIGNTRANANAIQHEIESLLAE